jgi:Nucleoside diphosphate kinase
VRIISASPPPDVVFSRVSRLFQGLAILPPTERTLAIIKPDAVAAGKTGEITERIKAAGFVIVDSTTAQLSGERVDAFYAEHTGVWVSSTCITTTY